jgi:hypothetical protein
MSASKRGTGASIGPKILLVAVVFVAGVIGISGIYPQVIDAEWVPDTTGTRLPVMSLSNPDARTRLGTAAVIPLPPRRVAATGQGTVSSPRLAPTPELSPLRTTVAAVEPSPEIAAPLAEIPDAQAKVDALPPDPVPAAAKPAEKPKVVVKKKVVHVARQRGFNGAYAQYNGWGGWPGGGWGGGGFGGGYR